MAAARIPQGASSSSNRCSYDVFLSFRGEDTRKGFTDFLYRALEWAGFHTFRDDDEIERGAEIRAELQKAIQESRVSIIVFSKDYASSTWCLDELAMIMKRTTTDGHMVVPVFYHVDPSHVRKQRGSFAEAFGRHEHRFKEEMDKVEDWRRALRSIADLGGMVLGDRYEGQFIQDIVEEVGNKLGHKALYDVPPFVVGMDHRVVGINMWLKDGSNDVGVAVICGMGGIGKTTIAKAAYNQNFNRFQGSSFLADINRETSGKPSDLIRLQRQLLSDIQKGKAREIYSTDEGMKKIESAVYGKRLLIVVDDVDHSGQLNAILRMREWLHLGSKIIITTRCENLLNSSETSKMFKVQGLYDYQSLELFSWHAFRQTHPIEGYMELSRSVVQHCDGLPLALEVLGSSLSGKGVDVWENQLKKLEVIPHGEIQKVLRISYDSLQDDHDKELFLHITCFFIGKKKDYTITILDTLDFHTRIGIQNLVDRCLVEINCKNKLVMHQLIRDMGRGIIHEESIDPGKRSRVWHHKEPSDILRKLTGTETIKGFMLNLPMLMKEESTESIFGKSNKKRCYVEDSGEKFSRRRMLDFFSWKSINSSSNNSGLASNEVDFKTEAFRRMHNLEILLLNNLKISGRYENFPKNLVWLSWQGFHLKSIPDDFFLQNLVVLELKNSRLQHVWKGTRYLPSLKILNLSHSHGLMTNPDLSGLPNLERLVLKDCINLVEVGDSIGDLEKLVFLNLKGCKNLVKLPARISMLRSLQELILSGCSKLLLHSNTTTTIDLHSAAKSMWHSMWSWALRRKNLELTSFSLANLPHCLGTLSLAQCNLLDIPSDLTILSSLKDLDLSGNPFLSLPENMNGLIMLQNLLLNRCKNLKTLPELPPNLMILDAHHCTSLERITNLPNAFRSLQLYIWECKKLVEVQSSFNIIPLRSVDIEMIKDMGLFNLESIGSTEEVEMTNYLTMTTRKGPVQALYECGIFSIFLGGSKILDWFSHRSIGNSVFSAIVPWRPNFKIRGLNVCAVYARTPRMCITLRSQQHILYLKVSNETKDRMWTYCPVTTGVPKQKEDMLWLSHWQFGKDELEGGEKVCVSVCGANGFWIKEFGLQFLYEQEYKGEGVRSNGADITPPCSQNVIAGDVSLSAAKYEFWPGKYFLCNHMHEIHQDQFRWREENPAHLDFLYEPEFEDDYHYYFQHQDDPAKRTIYLESCVMMNNIPDNWEFIG